MKELNWLIVILIVEALSFSLLLISPYRALAQESNRADSDRQEAKEDEMETLFEGLERSFEGVFDDQEDTMENLWARMEAEEEAKWIKLENEVLQKWDAYQQTSKKIWVDYSGEREAVSQVNFETGKIIIEALVPISARDPLAEGKKRLTAQVEAMLQKKSGDGKRVMKKMLSKETLEGVTQEKMSPSADQRPIVGKDGIERIKVRIELAMVPDHLKRRAERYTDLVHKHAEKRGLEPALVMAVMHTESAFNPMARSTAPAFGLMQLIPRFAAKESYQQLHGVEKVLTPDYLYNPENNIELGTVYLARLEQVYFKDVQDPTKRRYIAICAYNWGPTAMRNRFIKRVAGQIEAMKPEALFKLLQARVPEETKNYLKRVENRRKLYRG